VFIRSGSTCTVPSDKVPGATRQTESPASTEAPAADSIRIVMSMSGSDGTGGPSWCTETPSPNRAADSSSPVTNCEEPDASSTTEPPRTAPVPCTMNGAASPLTSTPSERRADSIAPIGRSLIRGSPSKRTTARLSAATPGRNRMQVPELPTFTSTSESSSATPGVTRQPVLSTEISQPRTSSAAMASEVSRASSPPMMTEGSSLSAASTRARLVIDFDPGGRTSALTGPVAVGACQVLIAMSVSSLGGNWFGGPGLRQ
jgi:hypothetical protein